MPSIFRFGTALATAARIAASLATAGAAAGLAASVFAAAAAAGLVAVAARAAGTAPGSAAQADRLSAASAMKIRERGMSVSWKVRRVSDRTGGREVRILPRGFRGARAIRLRTATLRYLEGGVVRRFGADAMSWPGVVFTSREGPVATAASPALVERRESRCFCWGFCGSDVSRD